MYVCVRISEQILGSTLGPEAATFFVIQDGRAVSTARTSPFTDVRQNVSQHLYCFSHFEQYWAHLEPILSHIGPILSHLGPILSHLESSWGPLGTVLGHLEPLWAHLGLSWAILGPSCAILNHLGDLLGPSWDAQPERTKKQQLYIYMYMFSVF